jgi:hypothetical protein
MHIEYQASRSPVVIVNQEVRSHHSRHMISGDTDIGDLMGTAVY